MFKIFKKPTRVVHRKIFIEFKECPLFEFSISNPRVLINKDSISAIREFTDQSTIIWVKDGNPITLQGSYDEIVEALFK